MASHPAQRCCIEGVAHTGTPRGTIKLIGGVPTYIVYPRDGSTRHAVLLMTDALGMRFVNTQLIADQFAANGYLAMVPDVFAGAEVPFPPPADFDLDAWCAATMPRPAAVDPIFEAAIAWLRAEAGVQRLGGVGYCFGAKYVCRWLRSGGLDAGFIAHPSFVEAAEVRGVRGPLSVAAAETDGIFPAEKRRETEAILAALGVPYQMTLYSQVEHGFATKGDLSHSRARFAKEQAFLQAVLWLDEYVKKESWEM